MYDKNRIEDSLEFVRQMKEFMDSDDALDEFDPFEDNDSDELFVNLAYHMEPEVPPKENAVQGSHAMGDSFGVPDAGVIQEQRRLAEERLRLEQEAAKRKQAEQEQRRRLEEERRRLEEEAAKRKQAEQEQQKRLEAERRRLEEEAVKRKQAEQEQQRRLEEERRRLEQEAERRRQAELQEKQRQEAERKKIEEERKRLAQEEAKRKQVQLAEKKRLEEERQRLAQEAERRRQTELQEKQRQEAERQKIEEERNRLAEEQKRQEQARRQLEKERQRLVEEQLQRELEEQRRILAEQARKKAEEKAKKEAEEKERRRKLLQEEEQRKKELQAREEQRRLAQEEEKKKEEQRRQAAESTSKQNSGISDSEKTASDDPESEVERLRKRAEELKRQAEMATLEARMRQLQLEAEGISTGESVIVPQTNTNANGVNGSASATNNAPLPGAASDGTAAGGSNSIPMPMLSIPGVQPEAMVSGAGQQPISSDPNAKNKPKLSKEEIDSIFAKELKKNSSESSYQQRKMMLQKQAGRLKRKREENGDKLPLELVKEKAVQVKNFTMKTALTVREFVLDKLTDPENVESREKVKKIMSNVLVIMICIAAAFLVSSIVTNFVAHPTKVEGESMETTLTDGDTVIIQKLSYYFGTPDRYDVVVFPIYNSETYYIKRVIGLPGETIQIKEGKVYINDKELEDDIYGKDEFINDPGDAGEPITLASDEYFVLGDNRNMSTDSRSSYVGVIKKRNIAGKAWRRVLPFSKNGKVK